MNQSLLEKAKGVPLSHKYKPPTDEMREQRIELALAYLKGEVTQTQVVKALWVEKGASGYGTNFYSFIVHGVRDAFRDGKIGILL